VTKATFLAGMFVSASAWYTEYPGFVHFHNWAGSLDIKSHEYEILLSDGSLPPITSAKDICATDPGCDRITWGGKRFGLISYNSSFDMYIANTSSVLKTQAVCHMDSPGCSSPAQDWLACSIDWFDGEFRPDQSIGTFALPPDLTHSTCIGNPECVAFRVKNDGTSGTTMRNTPGHLNPGWFALPSSTLNYRANKDHKPFAA